MKVRKTWFSNVLWFVFSCSIAVLFYFSLTSYLFILGIRDVYQTGIIVAVCGVVIVTVFCLLEWFFNRKNNRGLEERDQIFSIIALILLIILFFLLRILMMPALKETEVMSSQIAQNAMISGSYLGFALDTPENFYGSLLSVFFMFLGNKAIAVWLLQIMIQFIGLLFSYFSVKRLAGRIPALSVVTGITVLPLFFNDVLNTSEFSFLFLLFSACLWLVSFYTKLDYEKEEKYMVSTVKIVLCVLFSFLLGVLSVYHMLFTALFFLPLLIIAEKKMSGKVRKGIHIFLSIISGFAGFFVCAFYQELFNGSSSMNAFLHYFREQYALNLQFNLLLYFTELSYVLIVFIFCICYIIMFFFYENDEGHLFIFTALLESVMLFLFGSNEYQAFYFVLIICFLAIAGAGIRNLVMSGTDRKVKKQSKEERQRLDEEELEEFKSYFTGDTTTEDELEKEQGIQFIENPLPLPKKHERKEMDYAFEPDEEQMHFDYDLNEDNAFFDI